MIFAVAAFVTGAITNIGLNGIPLSFTGMQAGQIAGRANVTVTRTVGLYLNCSFLDFGEVAESASEDTYDHVPHPFVLENNGTAFVNVTVEATNLWEQAGNPTSNYGINVTDDNETNAISASGGWVADWIPMPATGAAADLMYCLNGSDNTDMVNVHINVTVPTSESGKEKTSIVTFIATDAGTNQCGDV